MAKPETLKVQVAVLINEVKNMRQELTYFSKSLNTNAEKDEAFRKYAIESKTAIRWIWGALLILFGAISSVFAYILN